MREGEAEIKKKKHGITYRMNFLLRQARGCRGLESKVTKKFEVREKKGESDCGNSHSLSW